MAPTGLRVEYLTNPMGVDTPHPRFFWVPEHSDRGQAQSAYEIIVSTDEASANGDMWSTGKVAGATPGQVPYAGKPLQSGGTYFWKVRYWDSDGQAVPVQPPGAVRLRSVFARRLEGAVGRRKKPAAEKSLESPKKIVRAKAFMCGLGYSEFRLNGRKVGRNVLDPAWTTYDKRALYVTYDVTRYLRGRMRRRHARPGLVQGNVLSLPTRHRA